MKDANTISLKIYFYEYRRITRIYLILKQRRLHLVKKK